MVPHHGRPLELAAVELRDGVQIMPDELRPLRIFPECFPQPLYRIRLLTDINHRAPSVAEHQAQSA
jgi:hypothetical protein